MTDQRNSGIIQTGGQTSADVLAVGDMATAKKDVRLTASTTPDARAGDVQTPDDLARRVFVIHGRDDQARECMYDFLRALQLHPLEWETLVAATGETTPFLGNVVATALSQARAAIVLLTPDDIVALHPSLRDPIDPEYEGRPTGQPRPNVLLELGMALSAFPTRTIIVEMGDLRPIADLAGRNVIRFNGSETSLGKLVERLKVAGCAVNDRGSDWRKTRRFHGLDAYTRKPHG
jgi:predicted nucleotide-binding protein